MPIRQVPGDVCRFSAESIVLDVPLLCVLILIPALNAFTHDVSKTANIQSMTGYASASRDSSAGRLQIELRSINSRFLDLTFRIPDELRSVEPVLRELISAAVARGKVECRVSVQKLPGSARQPTIDRTLLGQLLSAAAEIRAEAPGAQALSMGELMRWPGLFVEPVADADAMLAELTELAHEAIAELGISRRREGSRLGQAILERCTKMREIVRQLDGRVPELLAAFEQRLVERLRSALTDASSGVALPLDEIMERVRQEVVVHGLRIDVAEELSRLAVHLDELERVVTGSGPVGKRLDFLMQELNREANTLGSKAASIDLTGSAVDMKLLIEQIREQVQNLE